MDKLPEILRKIDRWLVCKEDKVPLYNGLATSVTGESFYSYDEAKEIAKSKGLLVGLCMDSSLGLTVIDLDVKDQITHPENPNLWTTKAQFDRYWNIVQSFDTYTEISAGGKGLHIWMKGSVDTSFGTEGLRRDGVEIYTGSRFIVCTSNAITASEVHDRQDMLSVLEYEIRSHRHQLVELVELEDPEDDSFVMELACGAVNSEKFNDLCNGKIDKYGFPSQSEADLALMSMLTFYSKSNNQCRRLFRLTELGQRAKATRNNKYIDYTLRIIRSRQYRENEGERLIVEASKTLLPNPGLNEIPSPPTSSAMTQIQPQIASGSVIDFPPGIAGAIAQFIYQSSVRPIAEVSICATLGFLAGVLGRNFYIPGSGLNLYLVLVAKSGVGKEALHTGVSLLVKSLIPTCPRITNYIDFSDYVSGQAIMKGVAANPGFANFHGEIGRKLKRLSADDGRDGPMASFRTALLTLYSKSGPSAFTGGLSYSDADKNTSNVEGAAFSIVGETTPSAFYASLTEDMFADGFLSRFIVMDYDGERPSNNENTITMPSSPLLSTLTDLCNQADNLGRIGQFIMVNRTLETADEMQAFDNLCDSNIIGHKDEGWRQMWNRAALKAARIAALLAVADNWLFPIITKAHYIWARQLVMNDIINMSRKRQSGDVGSGDIAMEKRAIECLRDYLSKDSPKGYKIPPGMKSERIFPRRYLQLRLGNCSLFANHRLGAVTALNNTITNLIHNGYIIEVKEEQMRNDFISAGKGYRIMSLPDFTQ